MNFSEAFKLMKEGHKVKLPSWAGYWQWENDTIMIYCKDGKVLDIRATETVDYTFTNITSDEWVLSDEVNTPILGGVAEFNFGEAVKYLKRGLRVARSGWNGKKMYLGLCEGGGFRDGYRTCDFIYMKTADDKIVPWLASQTDVLAEDWEIVD